jgi:hypothetical protein
MTHVNDPQALHRANPQGSHSSQIEFLQNSKELLPRPFYDRPFPLSTLVGARAKMVYEREEEVDEDCWSAVIIELLINNT